MTVALPIAKAGEGASAQRWRPHLIALAAVAAAMLLLFVRDAADMVRIWIDSPTFNHCALILPLIGWLVWQRLPELRRLAPRAWTPGLLWIAGGSVLWLLGEAGSLAVARHLALVVMLQGAVMACLGPVVARGLAFPLFYAFFLVPAGEEIVPLMQTVTAKICMVLLGWVGIPAHIEGVFISIPTGYFEVAEACSGVRFLVAMIAYGALVANVCFRSWTRRALFMIASIAIPILANGVRAWGTIYVAHLTSNEFAVGFDHILYGWIFFAIVIALMMAVGWPFFDRKVGDPWFDPEILQPHRPAPDSPRRIGGIVIGAVVLALLPIGWSAAVAENAPPAPARLVLPDVPGWTRIEMSSGRPWRPHFAGADFIRLGHYRDAKGREVDLAIAWFARQEEGREVVGYGQGAVAPDGAWAWSASGEAPPGGRYDRITSFGTIREVASFYRVGDILTGSEVKVKLETMKARLLGGPQRAAAVLVSSEVPMDATSARDAIDSFLAALGPVDRFVDKAAD